MTETRLREMLEAVAGTVPPTDLVTGRWQEASRLRRRRTGAALLASAAAVAAIVATTSLVDRDSGTTPVPPVTTVVPGGPDATIAGHPVYVSPDVADEAILPPYDGDLPSSVDLRAPDGQVDRAVYAFAAPGSGLPLLLWLVGPGGEVQSVPVPPTYGLALDVSGTLPFTRLSLTKDGAHVRLVTRSGWAVYDIAGGTWSEESASNPWEQRVSYPLSELEDDSLPLAEGWGPFRLSPGGLHARSYFSTSITEVDAGTTNPEVVAVHGAESALLVINLGDRFKGCCAVAGWLDDSWVVYESRTADRMRLLAWNHSDGQFRRIADITGLPEGGVVGSYADLSQATRTGQ